MADLEIMKKQLNEAQLMLQIARQEVETRRLREDEERRVKEEAFREKRRDLGRQIVLHLLSIPLYVVRQLKLVLSKLFHNFWELLFILSLLLWLGDNFGQNIPWLHHTAIFVTNRLTLIGNWVAKYLTHLGGKVK